MVGQKRTAGEGTLVPLEEEEESVEEEDGPLDVIWVKLPDGKKVPMVAPYDDNGDVQWLVPRDPRDLNYFEIPWDRLIDEKYRQNQRGRLMVVSNQPLDELDLIYDGEPHPEAIYKSRYDSFNGRHIVEALLSKKMPEESDQPSPSVSIRGKKGEDGEGGEGKDIEADADEEEKEKEEDYEADAILKTGSKAAKESTTPEPPLGQNNPKEQLLKWANDMKKRLFHKLIKRIREKQRIDEEKFPKVIKWMNSEIRREENEMALKRARKDRMRRLVAGTPNPYSLDPDDEEMGEGMEPIQGVQRYQKNRLELTSLDDIQEPSDIQVDKTMSDLSIQRSLDRLAEDNDDLLSAVVGEDGASEIITFDEIEAQDNFLRKVKRRAARERKKKYKGMVQAIRKLRKQLEEKCNRIQPPAEYFDAVADVLEGNEEELFQGWEPVMVFPNDLCLSLPSSSGRWFDCTCDNLTCSGAPSRSPKACIRNCECREKKSTLTFTHRGEPFAASQPCGQICKCKKVDVSLKSPFSTMKSYLDFSSFETDCVLGNKYRPQRCVLHDDYSDLEGSDGEAPEEFRKTSAKLITVKETVNQFRKVLAGNSSAFRRYLRSRQDSDLVPKDGRENDYPTPFSLKHCERSLFSEWLDKQKTIVDRIVMNANTARAAFIRGWINSPYYQFGVDSGLLMPPVDKEDEERIAKFKRSPGYLAKYNEFGKILEDGLFSEEKTQELVALGVALTDPFLKDFIDFAKSEREVNESFTAELQAMAEEDLEAYAQLLSITLTNETFKEDEIEGESWGERDHDKAFASLINERLNSDRNHWKGTKTRHLSTFWDSRNFHARYLMREKRRKELTGDLPMKPYTDEESLKKMLARNFDKIWLHPSNFNKLLPTKNWKPGTPEAKDLMEFEEFLNDWRRQWITIVNSVRDMVGTERKKRSYRRMVNKSHAFVRAFKRRLKDYQIIGEPQPFLVEHLGLTDKETRSYLSYLKRLRKEFVKQRKIDKQKIDSALSSLGGIMDVIEGAGGEKNEFKISPSEVNGLGEEDNLEEEEGGDFVHKSKTDAVHRPPVEPKLTIMFNKLYTTKELARNDFSKGPILVDKELIGLNAEQVKDLYKSYNVSVNKTVDPFDFYNEWRGSRTTQKRSQFACEKIHYGLKTKTINAIVHYMGLLHKAKLIDDDPCDPGFSSKKFEHYVQPILDIMKSVDHSLFKEAIKSQPKFPIQAKREGERITDTELFNEDVLNAWRALKNPMTDQSFAESSKQSEISLATISKVSSHKIEIAPSRKSNVAFDPYKCKKVRAWKKVSYDPYACLRALPRIGKRERDWYRSPLETEIRSFRRKHKSSFLKYLDVAKLKENPDDFNVWKMIASGTLFCKYFSTREKNSQQTDPSSCSGRINQKSTPSGKGEGETKSNAFKKALETGFKQTEEYKAMKKMFGDDEIWNWDMIGGSAKEHKESFILEEAMRLTKKHSPKNGTLQEDEQKAKLYKHVQKLVGRNFPQPSSGDKRLKGQNKNKKPENFVVFTTMKLPPFAEHPEHDLGRIPAKVDTKIEDRKLFKVLRSCGTLIFDITRSRHDLYICSWYLRKLYLKMERTEQNWRRELQTKRNVLDKDLIGEIETKSQDRRLCDVYRTKQNIILITSFVSWANSPPKVRVKIDESNFWKRKPHQDYYDYYTFENLLYRIGRYSPFNLRTTIVYSGLPFGCEEDGLAYVFKMAYEHQREIPVYGPGDNYPPMVHVADLSKVIASMVLPEYHQPMTCLVQPIKLSLKRRVYNVANQISYAHVRTQPTSHYEWDNILPKSVHDMLQLHVRAADVDLHELMGAPTIPKPFSAGSRSYQLFKELAQARQIQSRSVVLLGAPCTAKSDLAKAISNFYGIPLVTRQNILAEWLKLKQFISEGKALRRSYHKTAVPEEAEKDDTPKKPQFGPEEMKFVVADHNCDVNRNWLLYTLKFILRTKRYRRVGYVLCDVPMSEKDADFLFNNKNREPDPREFRNVAMYVKGPDRVIKVETDPTDFHGGRSYGRNPGDFDDVNAYYSLEAVGKDAEAFFRKRLFKIHQVNVLDEYLLEKVIDIIGPPPRPGGAQMYLSMMSRTFNDEEEKSEQTKQLAYVAGFFKQMQEKGLDLAPGLAEQCIPELQGLTKLDLSSTLQPYYVGYRHYGITKNAARSKVGPFREVRRKWTQKSSFFNQMPTDGNRSMWKKARRTWPPFNKNKEYITQYEMNE